MRPPHVPALGLTLILLAACGGDDGGAVVDAGVAVDAAPPVPLIGDVLTCGVAGPVGGMAAGTDLQRHDLDLTVFPDALCNDGTGAVIYYRPYEGAANRDRWVVQLLGGGGCATGQDCADRWCRVGTNFSMTQMTASVAPRLGTVGAGIFNRRPDNPIGGWNQVLIRYCSSDTHGGTSRDVVIDAADPVTGVPRQFRMHFLGARIVDAALATLRADGVPALAYTLGGGGAVTMPDLDDAQQLVLAGASAGGAGTIRLVDGVAATLRATNPGLQVRALIDSVFGPARDALDFSRTELCTGPLAVCDYQTMTEGRARVRPYQLRDEDSCAAWHQTHAPATAYQCTDEDHLIRHHLTTPMFVRMGQRDELISDGYVGSFSLPGAPAAMTLAEFAAVVRRDVAGLANLRATAEEGAAIARAPGGYSPTCSKHETLRNDPATFDVTIGAGAAAVTMFQVIAAWTAGTPPTIVVTPPGGTDVCPP